MSRIIYALNALDAARPAYETAESFYRGSAHETFTNPYLQQKLGSESSEFSFNYARLVITSRLSRMEVASITTQDGSADDVLAAIWSENTLDQELQDAFEASLVFGDAYLVAQANEDSFDIFYNSPYDTRVFYSAENPRVKSFAVKRWLTEEGKLRVNIYTADFVEKYISKSKSANSYTDGDFEEYYEEGQASWPLVNETGDIPVFHLRTGRMYGQPEHFQAYGPQRAITKLLSSQMETMDYQTAPQRYMIQDAKASNASDVDSDFNILADDDDDPISGLKAGSGNIWNLKGVSSVGQFDPASPDIFVTPFKTFIESIGTVTSTPVHAFNVGALPSGESLRAAEAPLNKRVESLETLFGSVLRELHEYALSTMGMDASVLVTWSPAATYDDSDVWATVKAKTEAGVPLRVALMEAGYTDAQVSAWYPEGETDRSADQIAKTADAIQKLGAAVTLGLLSREEARKLLPQDILIEEEVVDLDALVDGLGVSEMPEAESLADKANAMGVLIRAGVDPDDAATRVGLPGLSFTGAVPTSLRLPQAEATGLEEA